jgi:hypothetical protein
VPHSLDLDLCDMLNGREKKTAAAALAAARRVTLQFNLGFEGFYLKAKAISCFVGRRKHTFEFED